MSLAVQGVVDRLLGAVQRDDCVTAIHTLPPREAEYADWPSALHPALVEAVRKRGVDRLYSHQAEAVEHALGGRNLVVVTPTASGKTLCYNLPVLDTLLRNPDARALYLFPTKALAQDQLAEFQDTADLLGAALPNEGAVGIRAFTYDGDTPDDARRAIRGRAHVVVTNPDMLHSGILPHHARWARLFQNLRYVIIDELHTYRGVFGSHLCNVLRRLKRICRFYQGDRPLPVFVMSSATIANPGDLAARLTEEEVALVDRNGAPRGRKDFIFYNPPVINPELGIRRSCINQARWIASRFLQARIQTIAFTTSRLNVEVLTKYLKEDVEKTPLDRGMVRAYRGGYLPNTRREIERGLRNGEILGVVSTNALELGIDIGHLDVAVLAGYPGSVASTWQQAGRAGRRNERSVAILVARSDPMDQFIVQHPDYFFERPPEMGLINPDNLLILLSHVKCAAFELPMRADERFGSENLVEMLEYLAEERVLQKHGDRWHWAQDVYPADTVSLRSVSTENFVIMDETRDHRVIAEVDYRSAPTTVYQDAIYMCETEPYNVKRIDYDQRRVYVRKVEVDYYTEAITNTSVKILETFESRPEVGAIRAHGEVHVAWRVSGFKKIKFHTRENVGYGEVHLPDQEMHTTSYWLTVREEAWRPLAYSRAEVLDGVVGLAYVLHHLAPIHLMCDIGDIERCVGDLNARWFVGMDRQQARGRYSLSAAETGPPLVIEQGMRLAAPDQTTAQVLDDLEKFEPTIFLYDNYPGGIGFSSALYDAHLRLLREARDTLLACGCEAGCPSCVGPINEVGARSREVATALVARLLPDSQH
jgi:DEAD/DEAH box helicase domain-containing protein